jgi:hypothetical protein
MLGHIADSPHFRKKKVCTVVHVKYFLYLSDYNIQLIVRYYFDNSDYNTQLVQMCSKTSTHFKLISHHRGV